MVRKRLFRHGLLLLLLLAGGLQGLLGSDGSGAPLSVTGWFHDEVGPDLRTSVFLPSGISGEPSDSMVIEQVRPLEPDRWRVLGRQVPILLCLVPETEFASPAAGRSPYRPLVVSRAQAEHPIVVAVAAVPGGDIGSEVSVRTLIRFLDAVLTAIPEVDARRVYLTGYADAAPLVWELSAVAPDRFAAVVPTGGPGDPADAGRLVGVPIWALHATADPVPVLASRQMVAALWSVGSDRIRYTEYRRAGAHSWERAWEDPFLLEWLFSQSRQPR
jgi:predicted esterase